MNENGSDTLDAKWEMLLSRAKKDADELSNGNTVVMLTAKGTVYSVSLQNGHSAIEAEGVIKLFIEKKKNSDAKIERLICMWHDGSIDLPSYAFREALVSAEVSNLSAKMLLSGLDYHRISDFGEFLTAHILTIPFHFFNVCPKSVGISDAVKCVILDVT